MNTLTEMQALERINGFGPREIRLDFSRQILTGLPARGADLLLANFIESDISMADFRDSRLRMAFLQGAKLSAALLERSDMALARMQRADLSRAILEDVCLLGCDMRDVVLHGTDLQRAQFSYHEIHDAPLGVKNIEGLVWIGAEQWDRSTKEALQKLRARTKGATIVDRDSPDVKQDLFKTLDAIAHLTGAPLRDFYTGEARNLPSVLPTLTTPVREVVGP